MIVKSFLGSVTASVVSALRGECDRDVYCTSQCTCKTLLAHTCPIVELLLVNL